MTSETQRKLRRLANSTPNNFYELTALSRDIIDCWINLEYDYPSPYIDEFISIDSQADAIRLQGSDDEREEFFKTFREICILELRNLKCFISR